MPERTPFLADKCVDLLTAAMPRLTVIQHRDPWHGVHARGELEKATTVKYIYVLPASGARLALHLYPADTLSQARALYSEPGLVEQLLALRDDGWLVAPNFHFGFMTKGLTWTHSSLDADAYVAYWVERISTLSVFRREEWASELERLLTDGILSRDDVEQFDRDFINTDRNHATPRPGVRLARQWDTAHALMPGFPSELRATLKRTLTTIGQPLP